MIKKLEYIVEYVAKSFNVPVSEVTGKSRKANIVAARQTAQYFLKKYLNVTKVEIAGYFHSDHSSVIHAIEVYISFISEKHKKLCRDIENHLIPIYGDVDYLERNAKGRVAIETQIDAYKAKIKNLEKQLKKIKSQRYKIVMVNGQEQLARDCSKCKELKPSSEFTKAKSNSTAIRSMCKSCHNKRQNAWQNAKRKMLKNSLQKAA